MAHHSRKYIRKLAVDSESAVILLESGNSIAAILKIDITTPHKWFSLFKIWHADTTDEHSDKVRSDCSDEVSELMRKWK